MDKYDILEKLEGAKINFKNSMCGNLYFNMAMDQLTELIDELEKDES